ncbi:MAG: VOC family protein [Proteobacteria bacterium]|nr:VOC family protein [Pseudomonadota bacterium]
MTLDHLNLYVASVPKSAAFYDAVLSPQGYRRVRDFGDVAVGYGTGDYSIFAVVRQAPPIQPVHVAFRVASRAEVEAFYADAMAAGANDNGGPGLRPHYHAHYYAAFVLDPDGHNLEVVCHRDPSEPR